MTSDNDPLVTDQAADDQAADDYETDPSLTASTDQLPGPPMTGLYPEAEGFRTTPLWADDRPRDDHTDPREGTAVFDLYASGHGFVVRSAPPTARLVFYCKRCGARIIHPAAGWVCEGSGDVTERPVFENGQACRCNACELNSDSPIRRRPPEWCGPCHREKERERAAHAKEAAKARDRLAARDVLLADPTVSDGQVAKMIGVRPIRVREARLTLSGTGNTN